MTPRDAFAAATRRGHNLKKWYGNPYRPGLVSFCRRCGATLIADVHPWGSTFGGNTLRRDCDSIMHSKANRQRAAASGRALTDGDSVTTGPSAGDQKSTKQ